MLAQPLLLAGPRLDAWNGRLARASVVDVSDSMSAAQSEAIDAVKAAEQGTVFAIRIDATALRSGVRQAVERLAASPPARREIVIVSDFQRGALSRADLDAVPAAIGIRLVQVGSAVKERRARGLDLFQPGSALTQEVLFAGPATSVTVRVRLKPDATGVTAGHGSATAFQGRLKPDTTGLRLVAGEAGQRSDREARAGRRGGGRAGAVSEPADGHCLCRCAAGRDRPGDLRDLDAETVLRMRNDADLETRMRGGFKTAGGATRF